MKKRNLAFAAIVALVAVSVLTPSCHKDHNNPAAPMTFYDTLGGTAMVNDPAHSGTMIEKGRLGLRTVVDSAIFIIAVDTGINSYFTVLLSEVGQGNLSGFQTLSKNLTDFLCVATGAKNFSYTGKNMTDAHNPSANARISMKVDGGDFDEFVVDVAASAKKNGLTDAMISRVGALLNSLKTTVVQR